jgi:hypothetical protein
MRRQGLPAGVSGRNVGPFQACNSGLRSGQDRQERQLFPSVVFELCRQPQQQAFAAVSGEER